MVTVLDDPKDRSILAGMPAPPARPMCILVALEAMDTLPCKTSARHKSKQQPQHAPLCSMQQCNGRIPMRLFAQVQCIPGFMDAWHSAIPITAGVSGLKQAGS